MSSDGERTDLDPRDWSQFRLDAHRALDMMIDHIAQRRDAPVWRQAPSDVVQRFRRPLPREPRALEAVIDEVSRDVLPYATGNTHPLFMGWVHGAGTPVGMVGEMIAAGLDMNCGGRNHIGIDIERQITSWVAEALGLPADTSGLFVTGSSMANFLAVLVARTAAVGPGVRASGLGEIGRLLVAYTSQEAHGCIVQALEMSGLGSDNLRRIACTASGAMDISALADALARDRAAGLRPFLVVATAGTVNTGAIDPLDPIADVAARHEAWFHVDGAIGALACLDPDLAPLMHGISRARSVALDFHKWGHVPYDAGFLAVSDPAVHRATFANDAAYLQRASEGLAAGDVWPCDLGPDLSRSCRALKTWMTISTLGADAMGRAIAANCAAARHLAGRITASSRFELKAPVALNIVCFGLGGTGGSEANRRLVIGLQKAGLAAPSWTVIHGDTVIRTAIVNHRTTTADVDVFVDALEREAARL